MRRYIINKTLLEENIDMIFRCANVETVAIVKHDLDGEEFKEESPLSIPPWSKKKLWV